MAAETPGLFDGLFATPAMAALFTDRARVAGMLEFEAALARAEASLGILPHAAAESIAKACRADIFDLAEIARGVGPAGNPAIPLVKSLTARVRETDPEAARFVHWGATSQDAMDTGLVLQIRAALKLFRADLARLSGALARLAETHRTTPLAGRTWLQQALPTTFGLKAATWLDAIERHRTRLDELTPRLLAVQFGGAAGTLAALGPRGIEVATALAKELGLGLPDLPWHATRDRLGEFAAWLGLLTGSLGKMARDVSLLMQTEVAEAFEPSAPGRGGSSTMPHKRNPVASAAILAAAARAPALVSTMLGAMVQEHERGLGGWHAEWQVLPELILLAAGALAQGAGMTSGLTIDAARMRRNLDVTKGLILAEAVMMALGEKLGRGAAHDHIEAACARAAEQGVGLREILAADPVVSSALDATRLDRLCDPGQYLGIAAELTDRVLAARRKDDDG